LEGRISNSWHNQLDSGDDPVHILTERSSYLPKVKRAVIIGWQVLEQSKNAQESTASSCHFIERIAMFTKAYRAWPEYVTGFGT
jgi:hypothetical protein